jgi:hypothetical protein
MSQARPTWSSPMAMNTRSRFLPCNPKERQSKFLWVPFFVNGRRNLLRRWTITTFWGEAREKGESLALFERMPFSHISRKPDWCEENQGQPTKLPSIYLCSAWYNWIHGRT